ncbi:MAG: protein kinase [Gammaproteobacteria bacterium]|nr:protein kinase [Gammaproteobacteria bacterium]
MSVASPLARRRIGKYELLRPLGGGGMAEVYLARLHGAEGFMRQVALKRVLPGHAQSPEFTQRFIAEAQLLANLHHPNIVTVVDFDHDPDAGYLLVMEWVEGRDLSQLLATGLLPIPVVVHIIVEVLRGLGYAHNLPCPGDRRGVVHRDVSPQNVLVSWEGAVKVSDFGLAKTLASGGSTANGLLRGKPAYMSPEQANGQRLDGRSDLFSVGIMLWEMLIGQHLFSAGSAQEVVAQVIVSLIPPPRTIRDAVPQALSDVTMRLLERDPARRYPTAAHAIQALLTCVEPPHDGREAIITVMSDRFSNAAPTIPVAASDSEAAPSIVVPPRVDLAVVRREMRRAMLAPREQDGLIRRLPWGWLALLGSVVATIVVVAVILYARSSRPSKEATEPVETSAGIPRNETPPTKARETATAAQPDKVESPLLSVSPQLPPAPPKRSRAQAPSYTPPAEHRDALEVPTPAPATELDPGLDASDDAVLSPSLDRDGDGIPDIR